MTAFPLTLREATTFTFFRSHHCTSEDCYEDEFKTYGRKTSACAATNTEEANANSTGVSGLCEHIISTAMRKHNLPV